MHAMSSLNVWKTSAFDSRQPMWISARHSTRWTKMYSGKAWAGNPQSSSTWYTAFILVEKVLWDVKAPFLTTSQLLLECDRDVFLPHHFSTLAWTMYWGDVGKVGPRSVVRNCPDHWSWHCGRRRWCCHWRRPKGRRFEFFASWFCQCCSTPTWPGLQPAR